MFMFVAKLCNLPTPPANNEILVAATDYIGLGTSLIYKCKEGYSRTNGTVSLIPARCKLSGLFEPDVITPLECEPGSHVRRYYTLSWLSFSSFIYIHLQLSWQARQVFYRRTMVFKAKEHKLIIQNITKLLCTAFERFFHLLLTVSCLWFKNLTGFHIAMLFYAVHVQLDAKMTVK